MAYDTATNFSNVFKIINYLNEIPFILSYFENDSELILK